MTNTWFLWHLLSFMVISGKWMTTFLFQKNCESCSLSSLNLCRLWSIHWEQWLLLSALSRLLAYRSGTEHIILSVLICELHVLWLKWTLPILQRLQQYKGSLWGHEKCGLLDQWTQAQAGEHWQDCPLAGVHRRLGGEWYHPCTV